jgi:hypothetical protein
VTGSKNIRKTALDVNIETIFESQVLNAYFAKVRTSPATVKNGSAKVAESDFEKDEKCPRCG